MKPLHICAFLIALGLAGTAPAQTVVMKDSFTDPSSGWPNAGATHSADGGMAVYTDSGSYQMTPVKDHTFGLIPAPRQAAGGDVHIRSDLFLYAGLGAGAAGIACRIQDMNNFYAFIVRGDATVHILKVRDGKATPLAKGQVASVMAGTVDTKLSAECRGDTLRLSLNDGDSLSARDGELQGGKAGLFVIGEKLAGTSASFDNFELADLGTASAAGSR